MPTFRAHYGNDALDGVIAAASKIMMGQRDDETQAAGTEEDHPIVKTKREAASKVEEAKCPDCKEDEHKGECKEEVSLDEDSPAYVIDKAGHRGKLVKRNDDGTVDVNVEGEGLVTMPATTWSAKIRKYAKEESFKPEGEEIGVVSVVHEEHGKGNTLPGTQVMEGDEIMACDVFFAEGVEFEVPVETLRLAEEKTLTFQHKKND